MWKYLGELSKLQQYALLHDTILDIVHVAETVSQANFLAASAAFPDDNCLSISNFFRVLLFCSDCNTVHPPSQHWKMQSPLQLEYLTTEREIVFCVLRAVSPLNPILHFWLSHTAYYPEKIVSTCLCADSASAQRVGKGEVGDC